MLLRPCPTRLHRPLLCRLLPNDHEPMSERKLEPGMFIWVAAIVVVVGAVAYVAYLAMS